MKIFLHKFVAYYKSGIFVSQIKRNNKMETISIETFNNTSKVIKTNGSILSALKKEGYPNAQILGAQFGSLGNGKGSFWIKEGV